jgi:hypothetical protein
VREYRERQPGKPKSKATSGFELVEGEMHLGFGHDLVSQNWELRF